MTPDQPLSLALAIVGALLSILLPRRFALVPLALIMCLYPSTLLVPPKNLSLTPQRIIAAILLLRCIIQPSVRAQFRWRIVDTAALAYFLLITIAHLMKAPPDVAINNKAGFLMSALFPFWCVRFLLVDRPALYALLRGWIMGAVPLAILGLYQMQTGDSPYFQIMQYGMLWERMVPRLRDMRPFMGQMYFRAFAPFLQFIMFGWFFAILITPATNLFWEKRRPGLWTVGWALLPLGVISSISSGPMMVAGLSFALVALFPYRRYTKHAVIVSALMYVSLLIYSNRSPMEIIAQYGMDPLSSWYRVGLGNFTLGGGMGDHWLSGFGEIPLHYVEAYNDLCIHWVWLLVIHGLMGLAGFYGFVAACAWMLWRAQKNAKSIADEWLVWSLACTLLATLAGMLLVSLFSEMYFIYHMFLGVLANADVIVKNSGGSGQGTRLVSVLAEQDGKPVILRYALAPGQQLALVRPAGNGVGSVERPPEPQRSGK